MNRTKNWNTNIKSQYIEAYHTLQKEYIRSVLAHYKKEGEDIAEARHHAWEGAIKEMDSAYLARVIEIIRPKNILEVGSYMGFSTRWLLEHTQNWSAHVTSIDPNIRHRIFQKPRDHLITFCGQHKQRLKMIDAFLSRRTGRYPHIPIIKKPFGEYDFAFIDGNHAFEHALLNIALVAQMMPKGGIIIAHDAISALEVTPAIETLAEASPEIDYRIFGRSSVYNHLHRPPLSQILSIRKWNHYRLEKRRRNRSYLPYDGLGIIKVRHGQKLSDLDLKELLSKKNKMNPKKNHIIKQRILPSDSLDDFLAADSNPATQAISG